MNHKLPDFIAIVRTVASKILIAVLLCTVPAVAAENAVEPPSSESITASAASLPITPVGPETTPQADPSAELDALDDSESTPALANKTRIGAYGESHFTFSDSFSMKGGQVLYSGTDNFYDFHRFVTFLSHNFNDRIRFFSELELEHALVKGGESKGELELEAAYIDLKFNPRIGLRIGMLVLPLGIVNETHEPPTFYTVERGRYHTTFIPTTWFELGAGIYGELTPHLTYQLYTVAGLKAEGFSREKGIRGGRQKGFESNAGNPSLAFRLNYSGIKGLALGASLFAGGSAARNPAFGTQSINIFTAPVVVAALDLNWLWHNLRVRSEAGLIHLDAQTINAALHSTPSGSLDADSAISELLAGGYLEAGYNLSDLFDSDWVADLSPFVRADLVDMNATPAEGLASSDASKYLDLTFGLLYRPVYNVSFKFDWRLAQDFLYINRQDSGTAASSLELGVGYYF